MGSNSFLAIGTAGLVAAAAATTVIVTQTPSATTATAPATTAVVTDGDAARLAKQATFGPTPAVIARIKALGIDGWLDEQFAARTSSFEDLAGLAVRNSYCSIEEKANPYCTRIRRDSVLPAMRFYSNALNNDDQLRQRVALALFNIMPVSALKVSDTAALARYQQIMLDNAFGNFGDLLKSVITSGAMGSYLDHANSTAAARNENFGRELVQLFSIGTNKMNADGWLRRDKSTGAFEANYTPKDVSEISRALTGWTYTRFPNTRPTDTGVSDLSRPMVMNAVAFDAGSKTFLGSTIPAGGTPETNVDAVVKRLVGDFSMSPRITLLLIRALVKSNPSPDYINRASRAFRNNGKGVAGDLRALVRAILTDPEARTPDLTAKGGKLKDPILLSLALARAVNMKSDGYAFTVRDVQMGQQFLRAPSIFNDYPDDYPVAGSTKYVSGPSKLMTVPLIMERHNFVWQWAMNGDVARAEYQTPNWVPNRSPTVQDWAQWEAFGDDVSGMVDRIDLLLLNKSMTETQRAALTKAMTLVTDPSPALRARRRAQTGLFIVASSPQFQIDR